VTRSDIVAYLIARYGRLLAEAEVVMTDSVGGLKEPIDDALRAMGYAEADLATAAPTDTWGSLIYVRYQTLLRIQEAIADRFDVTVDGDSFRLQQMIDNVEKLITKARDEMIATFGVASLTVQSGTLNLGFLDRETDAVETF